MTSVFLELPRATWVAHNDLAFAIRDSYPVTEGHTLVIPRRVAPTWFDATRDEQIAILDLVDVVKQQLDEEFAPHGYNVGFNAGEAAVLGDVTDKEDRTPGTLGVVDEAGGAFAHLSDTSGSGREVGREDHLNRINNDDLGAGGGHLSEDGVKIGFGEQQEVLGGDAETLGSELGLHERFFSGHVQDAQTGGGDALGGLQEQR